MKAERARTFLGVRIPFSTVELVPGKKDKVGHGQTIEKIANDTFRLEMVKEWSKDGIKKDVFEVGPQDLGAINIMAKRRFVGKVYRQKTA